MYANFFTDHFGYDFRWLLFALAALLFGRTVIHFKVWRTYRKMPLLLGLVLVSLFIWITENIGTYNKTPQSSRKWCKICGGHIFSEHPGLGLTDVYAAVIPELEFKPGVHVNYQETALHIRDGLPKLKDFPKEFGGSGEVMPE